MKTFQAKSLRGIYKMYRNWVVKGKDTPLNVELEFTLDESSNLVTVEVLGENITDKDDSPSLYDRGGDDGKE